MKKIVTGLVAAGLVFSLAACSANRDYTPDNQNSKVDTSGDNDSLKAYTVSTGDGREVTCILWTGPGGGSVSCDWENAK